MVHLQKRRVGGKTYYYLEHSIRKGKKVSKRQRYLGPEVPQDLEELKEQFMMEILLGRYEEELMEIKRRYIERVSKTPESAHNKEMEQFITRFTYNTNRIEGSTLTLRETSSLLERGISPAERPMEDVMEARAHKKVLQMMMEYEKPLTRRIVLYWHKELFKDTKSDIAGDIRQRQVRISGSRFTPPLPAEIEPLLRDFFQWYRTSSKELNPVFVAALVHLRFVTIHPFYDGNGRISRLLMNFVLHKNGYPMMNISYQKRNSYYNALERSQVNVTEYTFLQWFIKRYLSHHQ